MATKLLLRQLSENKLNPKIKYVIEKGKLVPAKRSNISSIKYDVKNTTEEILTVSKDSDSLKIVNDQITDAVTQVIVETSGSITETQVEEILVETTKTASVAADVTTSTTKKKKFSKNK